MVFELTFDWQSVSDIHKLLTAKHTLLH